MSLTLARPFSSLQQGVKTRVLKPGSVVKRIRNNLSLTEIHWRLWMLLQACPTLPRARLSLLGFFSTSKCCELCSAPGMAVGRCSAVRPMGRGGGRSETCVGVQEAPLKETVAGEVADSGVDHSSFPFPPIQLLCQRSSAIASVTASW